MSLRLIFMGTPDFAVPTLVDIVGRGHDVVAVYTRAARPAGRGMELQPSPVEQAARGVWTERAHPRDVAHDGGAGDFSRSRC